MNGTTVEGHPAVNTMGNQRALCIASGCMMWRWSTDPTEVARRNEERLRTIINEKIDPGVAHAEGYCGKAGRP